MLKDKNPEYRLLLDSVLYPLLPSEITQLRQDITPDLDWQRFEGLAVRHRVGSLVYHNFRHSASDQVPQEVMERLEARNRHNSQVTLALSVEITSVVRRFEAEGIPACLLKGILLSQQVYGSPNRRDPGDIDILVPVECVDKAEQLLLDQGYLRVDPSFNLSPKQEQFYRQLKFHYSYINSNGWTSLELHWRIGSTYHIAPEITTEMLSRASKITFLGVPILNLTREDTLAFMIFHGSQHGWPQLKWLADLAAFLRQDVPIAWDKVIETITKMGVLPAFAQSFLYAQQLLGITIPDPVLAVVSRQPSGDDLRNLWISAFLSKDYPILFRFRQGLQALRFPSRARSTSERLSGLFLDPQDWQDLPLPDRLFWLYYFLRPFFWIYHRFIPVHRSTPLDRQLTEK